MPALIRQVGPRLENGEKRECRIGVPLGDSEYARLVEIAHAAGVQSIGGYVRLVLQEHIRQHDPRASLERTPTASEYASDGRNGRSDPDEMEL